jgi:hypothetical protein
VVKVTALRKGLYLRDRATRVRIVIVGMLGLKIPALRAFILDPQNVPDSNLNLTKSMTHHNQTKELTTWFLNLPLDESIDNKKHKV